MSNDQKGPSKHDQELDRLKKKKVQIKKVFKMKSDPSCQIILLSGKGKHIRRAIKMMGGDSTQMIPALMHQCLRLDGVQITMEDFDEFPMNQYMELFTVVSEMMGNES